jgi:hypothetical protein
MQGMRLGLAGNSGCRWSNFGTGKETGYLSIIERRSIRIKVQKDECSAPCSYAVLGDQDLHISERMPRASTKHSFVAEQPAFPCSPNKTITTILIRWNHIHKDIPMLCIVVEVYVTALKRPIILSRTIATSEHRRHILLQG